VVAFRPKRSCMLPYYHCRARIRNIAALCSMRRVSTLRSCGTWKRIHLTKLSGGVSQLARYAACKCSRPWLFEDSKTLRVGPSKASNSLIRPRHHRRRFQIRDAQSLRSRQIPIMTSREAPKSRTSRKTCSGRRRLYRHGVGTSMRHWAAKVVLVEALQTILRRRRRISHAQ